MTTEKCKACDGAGYTLVDIIDPKKSGGIPTFRHVHCWACEGTGKIPYPRAEDEKTAVTT